MTPQSLVIEAAEVEVNTACPRRCTYCPNSIPELRDSNHSMSYDLYQRILAELSAADYVGRLSFHLYSEPLLRQDLPHLIALAREALPLTFLVLYTNGDLLTDARYDILLRAGLDRFIVTRHDGQMLAPRPYQIQLHWQDLILTSRGGLVAPAGLLARPCHAPTEMLIVAVNGDVLLCHEDGRREFVMGNLALQSLQEVWWSAAFVEKRGLLSQGRRRDAGGLCARCNLTCYTLPGAGM